MPVHKIEQDALLFGGEHLYEDARPCLDWKQEACKDDYFFWQTEEERSASTSLFALNPTETSLGSPVLSPSYTPEPLLTTFTQETFEPTNTAVLDGSEPADFDLDAFVTDYLKSPQGQQILEETPTDPATLLFPEEILHLVDNFEMTTPDVPSTSTPMYVVDINSLIDLKPNVEIPAPSTSAMDTTTTDGGYTVGEMTPSGSESPYSSQDEESDISGDDDQDPDWCPQASMDSEDEKPKKKQSVSQGRISKATSSRPRKYGPRQPRSKEEKKERKKDQNRTAAVRYRERIRREQDELNAQLEVATSNHIRLQTKVETMRKDIAYFKQLMLTVLQARVPATPIATC